MEETPSVIERPDTKKLPRIKVRINLKEFSVYIILGVLISFAGSFMVRGVARKICYDFMGIDNPFIRVLASLPAAAPPPSNPIKNITIDWAQLYPFPPDADATSASDTKSLDARIKELLSELKQDISSNAQTKLYFHKTYLEAITSIEKKLSLTYIGNIFELDTGHIVENTKRYDMSDMIDGLTDFYDFLQDIEIDFLYVQTPHVVSPEDDLAKIYNFSNQNADDFLFGLDKESIPYLDLRQSIKRQNLDHYSMVFKTDHHWKPETGLWAAQNIAERLNAAYGWDIDTSIYNTENYDFVYENGFLGSSGLRATLGIAEPEPFARIFPKFPVDLTFQIPEFSLSKHGDFSVIYSNEKWDEKWEQLVQDNDPYNNNYYGVYTYTHTKFTSITNHLDMTGKKILIIRDSFSMVMNPFLVLGCENVTAINPGAFNGSIRTWIEQNVPDIVICMFNPNSIGAVKNLP
jgi:hypothetical protein